MGSVVHTVSGCFEVGELARAHYIFIVMGSFPWEEKNKWGKRACLGSQEDHLNPENKVHLYYAPPATL